MLLSLFLLACGLSGSPATLVCDFPVGPPDADGYRDAQPFGVNEHLGSDWNGVGGGNTDLGDPVFAMADGTVTSAKDIGGGWGNVVRIRHEDRGEPVISVYAHLDRIDVTKGQEVARGDAIGTIGTAGGQYLAHLHFEVRTKAKAGIGGGYGKPEQGQVDPTEFIEARRPPPGGSPRATVW